MTNVRYVSKEDSTIFFDTPSNFERAGFTSKPLDKETGLYNFPQRYYDSRNVKWLTLDPIGPVLMTQRPGSVESLNWYNYCNNNPVMYNDPQGLSNQGDYGYVTFDSKDDKLADNFEWAGYKSAKEAADKNYLGQYYNDAGEYIGKDMEGDSSGLSEGEFLQNKMLAPTKDKFRQNLEKMHPEIKDAQRLIDYSIEEYGTFEPSDIWEKVKDKFTVEEMSEDALLYALDKKLFGAMNVSPLGVLLMLDDLAGEYDDYKKAQLTLINRVNMPLLANLFSKRLNHKFVTNAGCRDFYIKYTLYSLVLPSISDQQEYPELGCSSSKNYLFK